MRKAIFGVIALVVLIGAISSGSHSSKSTSTSTDSATAVASSGTPAVGNPSKTNPGKPQPKPQGCGIKATDDCTPHLGPHGAVVVDTLKWRVLNATSTSTIGDTSLGLGAKANGKFVVVTLKVTNGKSESVDLTDGVLKLEVNGKTYDPDSSGTTAAIGAGENPLFLETLGPDVTLTSKVVFDVPPSVLHASPQMRFGELGFGDTKGYIALPKM
ncbi:MAG: DUF4352 domain-containing protein [Solirubrobacteraceae bacterium]